MRPFLLKLSLFLTLIAVSAVGLDTFLDRQMRRQRYDEVSVWNDIYQGRINAPILICGSSRAAMHLDPQLFALHTGKDCYNLGMVGHNFYMEAVRYRIYRQHNRKPRLLILSVDYESLQRRSDLFNHTQFIPYLHDSLLREATAQYEGFSRYDARIPLLKYVGEQTLVFKLVKDYLRPEGNKPDRTKGFCPQNKKWDDNVDAVLDTLKPYVVHPDSLSTREMAAFLQYCRAEQVQVIFVHTPVHLLGQQKVVNRQEMLAQLQQYAQRFHVPFYDYAADSMCADKSYFMNSTHLNSHGAALFTRKLLADLERDGWLRF